MSKFICQNKDCALYGVEDEYFKNTYKFVDGNLQSNNAKCPKCGSVRTEINPNSDIPLTEKNIEIGKYSSASSTDKKEILKKRSHEHYEKEIKPFKEHQLNTAVQQFKSVK